MADVIKKELQIPDENLAPQATREEIISAITDPLNKKNTAPTKTDTLAYTRDSVAALRLLVENPHRKKMANQ